MGTLLKKIFGKLDNALAAISIIMSTVSTTATIFLVALPDKVPWFILVRDIAVFITLLAVILFLAIKYMNREEALHNLIALRDSQAAVREVELREQAAFREAATAERIKILSTQHKNFHYLTHHFRSTVFEAVGEERRRNARNMNMTREERRTLRQLCNYVTYHIKKALITYWKSKDIDINDDIHVAVKLVVPTGVVREFMPKLKPEKQALIDHAIRNSGIDEFVITFYRDTDTHVNFPNREKLADVYTIDRNTAYHDCIRLGRPCFSSNDLVKLYQEGHYHNDNPEWSNQYHATVVVPIRYMGDGEGDSVCYGVIGVDSLNLEGRELYDNEECRNIMGHAADLLATFFLLLPLDQEIRKAEQVEATTG